MKNSTSFLIFASGIIISFFTFSCTPEEGPKQGGEIPGYYSEGPAGNWDTVDWNRFHEQAAEESLLPIRPGKPGKSPFWNGYAKRFIYVPSNCIWKC